MASSWGLHMQGPFLPLSVLALGSICAPLHGYVLLRLPDCMSGCVRILSLRQGLGLLFLLWPSCPCLHTCTYLCGRGCGRIVICMLRGISCAHLLVYLHLSVSLAHARVRSGMLVTTSVRVEVTKIMWASQSLLLSGETEPQCSFFSGAAAVFASYVSPTT